MTRSIGWRAAVLALVLLAEFAALEAGLRVYAVFEGSSTFQSLFMDDPQVGIRLRPNTRIRYTTVEFSTDIAINAQGVRDDAPIGPKALQPVLFAQPNRAGVFFQRTVHLTPRGHDVVARTLFEFLQASRLVPPSTPRP